MTDSKYTKEEQLDLTSRPQEKSIILKKSRRASRLKILQVFLYNVGWPPMMNQSAQRNTILSGLSICGSHAFQN